MTDIIKKKQERKSILFDSKEVKQVNLAIKHLYEVQGISVDFSGLVRMAVNQATRNILKKEPNQINFLD